MERAPVKKNKTDRINCIEQIYLDGEGGGGLGGGGGVPNGICKLYRYVLWGGGVYPMVYVNYIGMYCGIG